MAHAKDALGRPPRPLLLRIYGLLAPLAQPFAMAKFRRDLAREGVPLDRAVERKGHATLPRPTGPCLWFHAASIGESLSILPLVAALAGEATILVTSGTATSGKVLAGRLPPGVIHQFAPLDTPAAARRFLRYWSPAVAVFVESEIWPNLVQIAGLTGRTSLMLINARMSHRTRSQWAKAPRTAHAVFSHFDMIVTQNRDTHDTLAPFVRDPGRRLWIGGNMKAAAGPLPVDPDALAEWQTRLGDRPVWIASSTHEGEEEVVLEAHAELRAAHPDALLILVPRHPHRGGMGVSDLALGRGFRTARLGAGDNLTPETSVLVADTLGDLGLWYRVSPIVFLAGSLGEAGGHNPWEPIALEAALLHGPNVPNAAADYRDLAQVGAATEVADAKGLAREVGALISDPAKLARAREAARAAVRGADGLVERIAAEIRDHAERNSRPDR